MDLVDQLTTFSPQILGDLRGNVYLCSINNLKRI